MNPQPTPWWFIALAVILAIPVLSTPMLYAATEPDTQARLLTWLYPFYGIGSAVSACLCYRDRRALAWILLILLALSNAGMRLLIEQ